MLFFLGMVFASANSLAMDVGRSDAGTSAAILNVVKYVIAAVVAPLVGLDDILHSSAIVFTAVALIAMVFALEAMRLKPLPDMEKS